AVPILNSEFKPLGCTPLQQKKDRLKVQLKARKSINQQLESKGGPGEAGDLMESFFMDLKYDGLYRSWPFFTTKLVIDQITIPLAEASIIHMIALEKHVGQIAENFKYRSNQFTPSVQMSFVRKLPDSPQKRVNDPTSTDSSSSKKRKTTTKDDENPMLKKLIKELKDNSTIPDLTFASHISSDSYTYLYREIVKAEAESDIISRNVLICYFQFGKKISERLEYYKNERKYRDRMAQSKVDKEVKEQLPKEVKDNTRSKQSERARKIYELFIEIGVDKIQRVKSYSALTISKLSWEKIDYIIDSFKK
ncbi:2405_t:CDS:2, partial [Acaulospora colombiana]